MGISICSVPVLVVVLLAIHGQATTVFWTGGEGIWQDEQHWAPLAPTAGDIVIVGDSGVVLVHSSMIRSDIASLSLIHASSLRLAEQASLLFENAVMLSLSDSSELLVTDTSTLFLPSDSNVTFTGSALFSLTNSNVTIIETHTLLDGSQLSVHGSSMTIERGYLQLHQSIFSSIFSAIDISGDMIVGGSSFFSLYNSSLTIASPDDRLLVILGEESSSVFSHTDARIRNGTLSIEGGHVLTSVSSEFLVHGEVSFSGSVRVNLTDSSMEVIGGSISVSESAHIYGDNISELEIAGGEFILNDYSVTELYRGELGAIDGALIMNGHSSFICSGPTYVPLPTESLMPAHEQGYSTIEVVGATWEMNDYSQSTLGINGSTYMTVSGAVLLHDYAQMSLSSSIIFVSVKQVCSEAELERYSCSCSCALGLEHREECGVGVPGEICENLCVQSICPLNQQASECSECNYSCIGECLASEGYITYEGVVALDGNSQMLLSDSSMSVVNGSVSLADDSSYQLERSTLLLDTGAVQMIGDSILTLYAHSLIHVSGGHLSIKGSSSLSMDQSNITISSGSVQFDDNSMGNLVDSSLLVIGGNVLVLSNSRYSLLRSRIDVISAGLFVRAQSSLLTSLSSVNIDSSIEVSNNSSFVMADCSATVTGSLIATENGHLTVTSSQVTIDGSVVISHQSAIQMESSVINIQTGNLECLHSSSLSLSNASTIVIDQGTLRLEKEASIFLSSGSHIINSDQMILDGAPMRCTQDDSLVIEHGGLLSVTGKLDIRSSSISDAGCTFKNSGILDACATAFNTIAVPFENAGLFRLCEGSSSFSSIDTQTTSDISLNGTKLVIASPLFNRGILSGVGEVDAVLVNSGLVGHNNEFGTNLRLGSFRNDVDGEVFVVIDDPNDIEGNLKTSIDVSGDSTFDGILTICLTDRVSGKNSLRIEFFTFLSSSGRFSNIRFSCQPTNERQRSLNVIEYTDASCSPSVEYGSRNLAVVFSGCGNDEDSGYYSIFTWLSLGFAVATLLLIIVIVITHSVSPRFRKLVRGSKRNKRLSEFRRRRSTVYLEMDTASEGTLAV